MSERWRAFEDPRRVLRRHGLHAKRRYSQNFLVSEAVVEAIAAAVAPVAGEAVVELGPGLGTLTAALLRRGADVLALELDADMRAVLAEELSGAPVRVREGDAAALDLSALAAHGALSPAALPVALAGNLPYAVTGAILQRLVEQASHLDRAVLMVQREVLLRLVAEPGTKAYGVPSVFVQARFEVDALRDVPAGAFFPAPKVTSAVLRLRPRAVARADETPAFRDVVRAAFGRRRKTLRNALSVLPVPAPAVLEVAGIDGVRRGETLSVEEFATLAQAYATISSQRSPSST
ncbi:MAG: 16S rRNA (adenine(1518)-N(6)/adenine(1519)-N(6))-dimethyltransferase RsmA [Myxococcota bacterium]